MYCEDIRSSEELILGHARGAGGGSPLLCHILTPANHLHTEGDSDPCNFSTDVAQAKNTKGPALEVSPDRLLPASGSESIVFTNKVASARQN